MAGEGCKALDVNRLDWLATPKAGVKKVCIVCEWAEWNPPVATHLSAEYGRFVAKPTALLLERVLLNSFRVPFWQRVWDGAKSELRMMTKKR
jgi:hypothetical protein